MNDLKDRIQDYWANRASGYSRYNRQELEDERRGLWKRKLDKLLREQFPGRDAGSIRVLDIGTGPGFFARLLAESGYEVFAVDAAGRMLEEARKNAGPYAERIGWMLGDVQRLEEVKDQSFDALVTRNVTWNLPHPEKAYAEWYRILKAGGILLNFDADWYGYLFDGEKRSGIEKDRRRIKESSLEDLNDGEGVNVAAIEQIAREVPLSSKSRPEWDERAMRRAGFHEIYSDREVWREVWGEIDKINGGSTPMFLTAGIRRAG